MGEECLCSKEWSDRMVARDKRKGDGGRCETARDGFLNTPRGVVIRAKVWTSKNAGMGCDGQVPT